MLGTPAGPEPVDVADAMGEVANVIAGTIRNRLGTREPPLQISPPQVSVGTRPQAPPAPAGRAVCPYEMEGHPVSVELVLTRDERAGRS